MARKNLFNIDEADTGRAEYQPPSPATELPAVALATVSPAAMQNRRQAYREGKRAVMFFLSEEAFSQMHVILARQGEKGPVVDGRADRRLVPPRECPPPQSLNIGPAWTPHGPRAARMCAVVTVLLCVGTTGHLRACVYACLCPPAPSRMRAFAHGSLHTGWTAHMCP